MKLVMNIWFGNIYRDIGKLSPNGQIQCPVKANKELHQA